MNEDDAAELHALEAWFGAHGHELEYDLATGSGVDPPEWMAIVVRVDGNRRTPAYVTGYGATKLDAARSAKRRFLRQYSS